ENHDLPGRRPAARKGALGRDDRVGVKGSDAAYGFDARTNATASPSPKSANQIGGGRETRCGAGRLEVSCKAQDLVDGRRGIFRNRQRSAGATVIDRSLARIRQSRK